MKTALVMLINVKNFTAYERLSELKDPVTINGMCIINLD